MSRPTKIGILGGGQLGRMLLQTAANYHVETFVLENDAHAPASRLCHHFVKGDIRNLDAVYNFGKQVDVLTIEIENVNVEALEKLEKEGICIIPSPSALKIIKDKGLQKQFYVEHHIPTSDFILTDNESNISELVYFLPAAHKLRSGGYDGKGVEIIMSSNDINKTFNEAAVLEKLVDIDKEISVMVACNKNGETTAYPAVEMVFNPVYNLVDYLVSPADLLPEQSEQARNIAIKVVQNLNSTGIFAVEMFLNKSGEILVNETAPRAHNSGHQSIEGNFCSQFDMQMRTLLNLPLGNVKNILPSLMINLIGEQGYSGPVVYEGLEEVYKMPDTYVHLYGKRETKPGRKMGHITILGGTRIELIAKADKIRQLVKVRS